MTICRTIPLVPVFALLLLFALLPTRAAAQESGPPTPVDSLAMVRVEVKQWLPIPRRVQGRLVAADNGSITVRPRAGWDPVVVPLTKLRRVEVSVGRRTREDGLRRGALRGFAAGAASIAVFFAAGLIDGECEDCYFTMGAAAKALAVPLTVTTTVSGAIGGALFPGERWVRVHPPVVLDPPRT